MIVHFVYEMQVPGIYLFISEMLRLKKNTFS